MVFRLFLVTDVLHDSISCSRLRFVPPGATSLARYLIVITPAQELVGPVPGVLRSHVGSSTHVLWACAAL